MLTFISRTHLFVCEYIFITLWITACLLYCAIEDMIVFCVTAETIWLNLDLIKSMVTFCEELFPVIDYAQIAVPTYPTGQIGCLMCSINPVCYTLMFILSRFEKIVQIHTNVTLCKSLLMKNMMLKEVMLLLVSLVVICFC